MALRCKSVWAAWPALHLAQASGCDVTLTDLPLAGLRIAAERAGADGLAQPCQVAVADAGALPFPAATFDAVTHSDVLCCLPRKRAVLSECRRVVRARGRMVFSVIAVAPGLAAAAHGHAVANGPDFIEAEADYATLLHETGWAILERQDVTSAYAASCRRQLRADSVRKATLTNIFGAAAFADRLAGWRSKLACLETGLLRRELFAAAAVA